MSENQFQTEQDAERVPCLLIMQQFSLRTFHDFLATSGLSDTILRLSKIFLQFQQTFLRFPNICE